MNLHELIYNELQLPLPGKEHQNIMLPTGRSNIPLKPDNTIEAGVAIIISNANQPEITLMKRTEYDGHHSGQVSFPGGKKDQADINLLTTAIRESYEEIGLQLAPKSVLGQLTPLHITVSGFLVTPFVFWYPEQPVYKIDPNEVQYVIPCKLNDLLNDNIIKNTTLKIRDYSIDTPYYKIGNEIVWGATSMILSEFREVLTRIVKKNPGIKLSRD